MNHPHFSTVFYYAVISYIIIAGKRETRIIRFSAIIRKKKTTFAKQLKNKRLWQ